MIVDWSGLTVDFGVKSWISSTLDTSSLETFFGGLCINMSRRGVVCRHNLVKTEYLPEDHNSSTVLSIVEAVLASATSMTVTVRVFDKHARPTRPCKLYVMGYTTEASPPSTLDVIRLGASDTVDATSESETDVVVTGLLPGNDYLFSAVAVSPYGTREVLASGTTSVPVPLVPYSLGPSSNLAVRTPVENDNLIANFDTGFTIHARYRATYWPPGDPSVFHIGLGGNAIYAWSAFGKLWVRKGGQDQFSIPNTLTANVWYHLHISFTATQAVVYLNGALQNTHSISQAGQTTSGFVGLGSLWTDPNTTYGSASEDFRGYYNEFAYFDGALSADQISGLYNDGVPFNLLKPNGAYDASAIAAMKAYWRFNNDLLDYGPHGCHMELQSGSPTFSDSVVPS
jgi:hypothetical protein